MSPTNTAVFLSRGTFILGIVALAGCKPNGAIPLPKDRCQQIFDTVKAKADLPARATSQYLGPWRIVSNNTMAEVPLHRIVTGHRGKVVLQSLANAELHMTRMDQQGVTAEWVGSSDEDGLYLYLSGDRRIPLWLSYSGGRLQGTMTSQTCGGHEFQFVR